MTPTPLITTAEPLRIAIVGCGAIADYLHAPAMAHTPEVRLSAVVDADRSRAEQFAKKTNVTEVVTDLQDLSPAIEAVVLATPPDVRPALVQRALARGLHVLCEKPFANTVAECVMMSEAATRANRVLGVCHQFRFWPAYRRVRDALRHGEFGPVQAVEAAFGNVYSWQAATGYTVRRDLVSGGVLVNSGTHWLDTLLTWFGDPLSWEYADDALGGLESNVRMTLRFADPTPAHPGEFVCRYRQTRTCRLSNEFRVRTAKAVLTLTNNQPFSLGIASGGTTRTETVSPSPIGYLQPASDLYRDFATAIRTGQQPEVNGFEGTRVLRLIEDCYAAKRNRPLPRETPVPGATW